LRGIGTDKEIKQKEVEIIRKRMLNISIIYPPTVSGMFQVTVALTVTYNLCKLIINTPIGIITLFSILFPIIISISIVKTLHFLANLE